ncbi:hypothetical protein CXB51_003168 [Gossypium anomalum]|uniref:CCHC-type domain-containing protein n=1 Tax=Gossypium anomalum TaxID=47600 RepID=A0A8J5Z5Q5_9ROSI|nr:hypothetical protein CXB51_003168 [Gossypium anomalum]
MAKKFGDFCGKFIEYDTSIPSLGRKKYMHIRIRLDVSAPLKRKKKIQIGKDMIVYAQFNYEKVSLFCFICGRLGHGESYCPYSLRIEPSKIIFGWDLSLRAVPKIQGNIWSKGGTHTDGLEYGPIGLVSEEENDPIAALEGKKRQRIVEDPLIITGSNAGNGSLILSASSVDQSSRVQ